MLWLPLGPRDSRPSSRPVLTTTVVAILLLGALLSPAEEANLAELDGWTAFVSYMASHPTLRVPEACSDLLSGGGAIGDDAVPGDPREALRRCDRVVTQLNLSGWRRIAVMMMTACRP